MQTSLILQPTREEILERFRAGQELNTRDLLHAVSRSFSKAISHLETLKGPEEVNKRAFVQELYNSLRGADEIEDGRIPIVDKIQALDTLHYVYVELARRKHGKTIDDLIKNELREASQIMWLGAVTEDKQAFAGHFGRGIVIRAVQEFPQPIKQIFAYCVGSMVAGMRNSIQQRQLQTLDDLRRYCDYVAGFVGVGLNHIVKETDGSFEGLTYERAMVMGRALQLTNIVKNIREDEKARSDFSDARTLFLPRELYSETTPNHLFYGNDKGAKDARARVFYALEEEARKTLNDAHDYLASIPNTLPGYKAFVFGPFVTAIETWKTMIQAGAEEVFKGEEQAIKIPKQSFLNIVRFTEFFINSSRVNAWLEEYVENPRKYSFADGDNRRSYNIWAPKLIDA